MQIGHWRHFNEAGVDVQLWINDPPDTIQMVIENAGMFYEAGALRLLRALLPAAPRIVDIGANLGNHSVYFARVCNAAWLLPIESNPEVIPELRANLAINQCDADLSCLGLAVGARQGKMISCLDPADAAILNRGGTRLVDNPGDASGPAVSVVPLDELVAGHVDLLKIDVEGMAVAVLNGAHAVITRCAPLIFVEVGVAEMPAFFDWLSASSYRVAGALSDYIGLTNLILQPTTSRLPAVTGGAMDPQARIAQALTSCEVAIAHAERADAVLRSTLVRSGARERAHVQATAQTETQVASLTETVNQLNNEIARLRQIESGTTFPATYSISQLIGSASSWLPSPLRRRLGSSLKSNVLER